jgi:serine palmitoyltransferase
MRSDSNTHVLLYGSLTRTLGLPGGYLAGPECLIRELRYTSRGYMFTTSPPPFVMDMIRVALERYGRQH